jgi:hypothetical protein
MSSRDMGRHVILDCHGMKIRTDVSPKRRYPHRRFMASQLKEQNMIIFIIAWNTYLFVGKCARNFYLNCQSIFNTRTSSTARS